MRNLTNMNIAEGDKLVVQYKYEGSDTTYYYKLFHIINKDEYESAKKLAKEENITVKEIFGIKEQDFILVSGSPLYSAVRDKKLGTWVSVATHKDNDGEDSTYECCPIIILYKDNPFYKRIMYEMDFNWFNYGEINEEVDIKLLNEQTLLIIAGYASKSKYKTAISTLHSLFKEWSFMKVLNTIAEIKSRRLTERYGYFYENKT